MCAGGKIEARSVADACSEHLAGLSPDDDQPGVELMREHSVRRLPVIEEGGPVGIVSLGGLAGERDTDSALGDIRASELHE